MSVLLKRREALHWDTLAAGTVFCILRSRKYDQSTILVHIFEHGRNVKCRCCVGPAVSSQRILPCSLFSSFLRRNRLKVEQDSHLSSLGCLNRQNGIRAKMAFEIRCFSPIQNIKASYTYPVKSVSIWRHVVYTGSVQGMYTGLARTEQ